MKSEMRSFLHYKGGTYTLLYIAENSNQRDELMAVYVSHLRRHVLVRPYAEFVELVQWQDGQLRPRYLELTEG